MKIRHLFLALVFLVISAVVAFGQDVNRDGRVTYLVPLNVPVSIPGALGSTWRTEIWVHNGSEYPFNIQGCPQLIFETNLCDGVHFHPPGSTEKATSYETIDNGGFSMFLFSLYPWQSGVVVTSRLYELSRHAQPAGVEIPVVREDQFFTKASRFIGIPRSSAFRVALRVYNPMRANLSTVRVELFDSSGQTLGLSALPLVPQTIGSISPGYAAILDLGNAFPQLNTVDRFDIRVTPVHDGMTYWAFVSVTDQDTQTVLLVTADK